MSFTWATSRAASCLERIIPADFTGTVQCDGCAAYPSFARGSEGRITLAACWAHARRKFHEAIKGAPQQAGWLLHIQHLYRIEAHLCMAKAGLRQRQAVRASQSRMNVERIHKAVTRLKLRRRHLPQSAMGRAIDYTLTLWTMLIVYLEDGRVENDNNPVERAIRPTAVGKKELAVSSARRQPDSAARCCSRSSKPAAAVALIHKPTCAACSPACPR